MFSDLVVASTTSTTLGSMLFVSLSFLVLLLLLKKFAWQPVIRMLDQRADKISNDIDSAESSRRAADKLVEQRESELQQSRIEARAIISEAKETAENSAYSIIENAKKHAQDMKEQAEKEIRIEREKMMDDSKKEVAELSIQIASKILKKEISLDVHQELIQSSIDRLEGDGDE
ncbi:F0F1 ATP synthase subunit B [Vagococcus acidifermentans]|uniref:ATP synthase subunit b n=1 Tax=Vagococcus acidifermentans TaxID=564710 RepID=A0A430ATM2_9ENTE|nr:F0F1 ATP synthase subunit B [Vagococcus acidifermentans]RSU11403.1 ATP synthase F0 subunit B [Vagococcus acidifermentans]